MSKKQIKLLPYCKIDIACIAATEIFGGYGKSAKRTWRKSTFTRLFPDLRTLDISFKKFPDGFHLLLLEGIVSMAQIYGTWLDDNSEWNKGQRLRRKLNTAEAAAEFPVLILQTTLEEIAAQMGRAPDTSTIRQMIPALADLANIRTGWAEMTGMGITPAIVMESSPGNFQAILKFPKNSEDDIEHTIANEIARTINIIFGDCSFSGAEHPHRAPGFINLKSEYFVDGASPTAQIICAQNVMCDLLSDYSRWARRHMEKIETYNQAADTSNETVLTGKQDEAIYLAHLNAVLKIMGITFADADMSAIDSIIAIRLRGTGHTKNSVAGIIAAGGLATRPQKHNWPDYSARTANYAFGHAGNSQLQKYERWIP